MAQVSIRELRNHGGDVIDRVLQGEQALITRDGKPVAELRPLPSPRLSGAALLERWRPLPAIDPIRFRADIDRLIDNSL